jgi:Mg-chelatase subunit ChlD
VDLEALCLRSRSLGKRCRAQVSAGSGRYVRAVQVKPGERFFDVAVDATLRAALIRPDSPAGPHSSTPLAVTSGDLRKKQFKRPQRNLFIIVVDASDSMGQGTNARMKAAKGAALAILAKAHLGRHRVGMVAFRDKSARIVLQPTASISRARRQLRTMATGGATPFADGLMKAWQVIKAQRVKDPGIRALMVVISDGEANVAYDPRRNALNVMDELMQIAQGMARDRVASIVIDTRPLSAPGDAMQRLARALGGGYRHVTGLHAGYVVDVLKSY